MEAKLIEKENVSKLHFRNPGMIKNKDLVNNVIVRKLKKATSLGNLYHEKVNIFFKSDEGFKEVRTTIWATTEKHILLKKGVFIPIVHITNVTF